VAITVVEYEKLVLSVILVNALPSSILPRQICAELTADKFSVREHKEFYRNMVEIVNGGDLPNIPTIAAHMGQEKFNKMGGEPYLRSLQNFLTTMGITEVGKEHKSWVRLVDVAGRCRILGTVVKQYADKLSDLERLLPGLSDHNSFDEFLSNFLNDIQSSGTFGKKSSYQHISTLYDAELARLRDAQAGISHNCIYVGWPQFKEFGIPRYGVLNVLAGLTGSGKTALASLIAVGAAVNLVRSNTHGHVAYNCLEDSKEELYSRLACALTSTDSTKLKKGTASLAELENYDQGLQILNQLPIYIDDNAGITSTELMLEADLLKMTEGAGQRKLGVSDYSELFGDKGKDENLRLSALARNLHTFARDRGSGELLLTQYPELYNPDQIGGMRSKQARAIGQASKVYMEIWNLPELMAYEYANSNFDSSGNNLPKWADSRFAYVLVHKNSGGVKGRITMTWEDTYTQFRDTQITDKNIIYDL
jgi:replicative DNA helicase